MGFRVRDPAPVTEPPAPVYRSALVPVFLGDVNGDAMERAAKLVGPGADIECVFLVIVPPRLPLDTALKPHDEEVARSVLESARIAGRRHGLRVHARILVCRDPGLGIVEEARRIDADLVYLAQAHMPPSERGLGRIGRQLLRHRPCRVIIETGPPSEKRWGLGRGRGSGAGR